MPNLGSDLVFELFLYNLDGEFVTDRELTISIIGPDGSPIVVSPDTAEVRGHGYLFTLDSADATQLGSYEAYGTPDSTTSLLLPYAMATVIVEPAISTTPHVVLDKLNSMISGTTGDYSFTAGALENAPALGITPEEVDEIIAMSTTITAIKAKTDLIIDGTTPIYLAPVPGPVGTTLRFFKGDTYRDAVIITAFDDYGTILDDEITYTSDGFSFIVRDSSLPDESEAAFEVPAEAYSEHSVMVPLITAVNSNLLNSTSTYIYQVQATYVAGGTRTIAHGVVNVLTNANP